MKILLIALSIILTGCAVHAQEVPWVVKDTVQTSDSNSRAVSNVFAQGNSFDQSYTAATNTVTDLLKRKLGYTMTNGHSMIIEIIATTGVRYKIATDATGVAGNNGSVLPANLPKQLRVRSDDKLALLRQTTNGSVNVTRVR